MFSAGASSSSSRPSSNKAPANQLTSSIIPTPKGGVYLYPWEDVLPKEERRKLLEETPREGAERFLELCTIQRIQSSPLKLDILERWEKEAFLSFHDAREKLIKNRDVWIDCNPEKEGEVWYVDIGHGRLSWYTYSLILQFCREQGKVVVCADPSNLRNRAWTGWTEILLDRFCP